VKQVFCLILNLLDVLHVGQCSYERQFAFVVGYKHASQFLSILLLIFIFFTTISQKQEKLYKSSK